MSRILLILLVLLLMLLLLCLRVLAALEVSLLHHKNTCVALRRLFLFWSLLESLTLLYFLSSPLFAQNIGTLKREWLSLPLLLLLPARGM